jgi:hypothetical protein
LRDATIRSGLNYAGETLNIDTYVIHVNGNGWCLELNGKHLGTFNERAIDASLHVLKASALH